MLRLAVRGFYSCGADEAAGGRCWPPSKIINASRTAANAMLTHRVAQRGRHRALSRSGVGVRMISTAAGVFLAFLTVGHTQSNTRALSSAEPPRLQSSVERLPVAADHTRQNRQTARLSDPGVVQSRHVDLELHQLYDEIMRRVDMSYKDAR